MTQNLTPTIVFPYINYKGYFSTREVQPISIIYDADNEYHSAGFILKGHDIDKESTRDYCFTDILRATYYQAMLDMTGDTMIAKLNADVFIKELEGQYK